MHAALIGPEHLNGAGRARHNSGLQAGQAFRQGANGCGIVNAGQGEGEQRVRPMLGFKSVNSARASLSGIEVMHMMRKGQADYARNRQPSLTEQFEQLAA
jgi:hypothetical protein